MKKKEDQGGKTWTKYSKNRDFMAKQKVLIIAPHMDDEALGCGGTICKHIRSGDYVSVIFVAHRIYDHKYDDSRNTIEKSHALKARTKLGYKGLVSLDMPDERLDGSVQDVIISLEKETSRISPDTVYLPFRGDNHQDHRAVFDASRVVFRPSNKGSIKSIYMYEVPSSTEQSPPVTENAFIPNRYVNIGPFISKKLSAIACYETEKRDFPNPRSLEAVRLLARKRGSESGFSYAEAFMVLRNIWD